MKYIILILLMMPLAMAINTNKANIELEVSEPIYPIFKAYNLHVEYNIYGGYYESVWNTNYPSNTILSIEGYPDRGTNECVTEHRYPIWHTQGMTITHKGTSYKPCDIWTQQANTGWKTQII